MGTVYYGVISEIKKARGDVGITVGRNFWSPTEEIHNCKSVIEKIRSLKGNTPWYCSTLRKINEIMNDVRNCNPRVLLYLLIVEELGVEPEVVSEYDRGYDDDREFYDLEFKSEVSEVCKKLFEGKRKQKYKNRKFRNPRKKTSYGQGAG